MLRRTKSYSGCNICSAEPLLDILGYNLKVKFLSVFISSQYSDNNIHGIIRGDVKKVIVKGRAYCSLHGVLCPTTTFCQKTTNFCFLLPFNPKASITCKKNALKIFVYCPYLEFIKDRLSS